MAMKGKRTEKVSKGTMFHKNLQCVSCYCIFFLEFHLLFVTSLMLYHRDSYIRFKIRKTRTEKCEKIT